MASKKILITVGGTGGHVFPAMALARRLIESNPSYEIFFVGGGLKSNPYFLKDHFSFQETSCGSLSFFKPFRSIKSIYRILKGISEGRKLIKEFAPDIVIGFGSYYTLPTLIAAKIQSIPIILHEANSVPGRVNRFLSPYATLTAIHFPDAGNGLKGKSVTVGIPLRSGYQKDLISKKEAADYFKLASNLKTILIFGGSQGAQAINRLASQAITEMPEDIKKQIQILHFTGDSHSQKQIEEFYKKNQIKAKVSDFENRMDLAWQAADLLISRSGAGTLAEQQEYEVPGLLIPYPYATDNHQESNADYMVDIVGGAIKLGEKDLTSEKLASALTDFLSDEGFKLQIMQEAMNDHKRTKPVKEFHTLVKEILNTLPKGI